MYQDLQELLDSYSVTGQDEADELAPTVVRRTLDELFVLEPVHPDGEFDGRGRRASWCAAPPSRSALPRRTVRFRYRVDASSA